VTGGTNALHTVNQYRAMSNLEPVTSAAVRSVTKLLEPKISSIVKSKQGSASKESPWAKARLGWCKQLAVKLGKFAWCHETMGPCPPEFDADLLTGLHVGQIAYWDETHIEQCVGGVSVGSHSRQYQFRRDKAGGIDLDSGDFNDSGTECYLEYR
jgi:hypothetical protein